MQVLFLQLNVRTGANQGFRHQAGCAYLMGALRAAGHDVAFLSVVDPDPNALNGALDECAPQVVGVYLVGPMEKYLGRYLRHLKGRRPDTFVLVGGPHPTIVPTLLEESPDLDAIYRGEADLQMPELVRRMEANEPFTDLAGFRFRRGDRIIDNPLAPLPTESQIRELPLPYRGAEYREALEHGGGCAHFIFSRGCPFECTYCSNEAFNRLFGFKLRVRTVEQSLAEIDDVLSRFPVKVLGFDDDIVTLKRDWFERFMREYRNRFDKPFIANVRVGCVTRDQLVLMKEAGASLVQIGIESGDPTLRKEVLGRDTSDEAIAATFEEARAAGLRTSSFNMVGLPYETPEAFMKSVKLNAAVRADMVGFHIFYPYRGTAAWEMCAREGWIGEESDDFVERVDTILRMPQFTRDEILWSHRNVYRLVKQERLRLDREAHARSDVARLCHTSDV